MQTVITARGCYDKNGKWILTDMILKDQDEQKISISLQPDGSYDFISQLIGDEMPVTSNVETFYRCWEAIPVLFGYTGE